LAGKKMSNDKLRTSQLITTYGPGAMVDLPKASLIVSGLDSWVYDPSNIPIIQEPRLVEKLQRIVNKKSLILRNPPPESENLRETFPHVVGWRFPEWFIVQRPGRGPHGYLRRRLVNINSLNNDTYRSPDGKTDSVVPVRFVRACPKGHVGDVDWKAFLHGNRSSCTRDLWVEERGTSGDLSDVWICCECGTDRSMSQAMRGDLGALGMCNGARPWLGAGTREKCGLPNKLLIRSASNAYFPQIMSVISIPDPTTPIDDVVRSLWDDFLSDVETIDEVKKIRMKPTPAVRLQGITDELILESIARIRTGSNTTDRDVKEVEFDALTQQKDEIGEDVPDGNFYARTLPRASWECSWTSSIERVVLVHRLREVVAQVGFTRFEAAGPDIQGELDLTVESAPLAIDASWLPAVENRGEGIFIQFNANQITTWMQKATVIERAKKLAAGFDLWRAEHPNSKRIFPGIPYYLLHSFSHLLLTAISLECGYPSSSIRERIYVTKRGCGVLIYTGSSDAEGTLGGLVAAGRDIRRHSKRALELGLLCSNDPVCGFHVPTKHDSQHLLGSACHGCLLIAETSCEQKNEFMDRSLVVPTVEASGCEFFNTEDI
jgi:hypothetical protein